MGRKRVIRSPRGKQRRKAKRGALLLTKACKTRSVLVLDRTALTQTKIQGQFSCPGFNSYISPLTCLKKPRPNLLLPGERTVGKIYFYKRTNIYGVKVNGSEAFTVCAPVQPLPILCSTLNILRWGASIRRQRSHKKSRRGPHILKTGVEYI